MSARYDAIVVGGGLAGVAAAVAVAKAGLNTLHLAPKGPPDRRTSALMGPSVDYLRSAGLIDRPADIGHPLTQIRIIDATDRLIRAPETLFDSSDAGLPAFGWNFPNIKLLEAFETARSRLANLETREVALSGIERTTDSWQLTLADGELVEAPLVVGSDGKKSLVRVATDFRAREHGFTQAALVCDLELARPLGGASVEFHYEQGPFTLVPAGGSRANLVWIDDREVLKAAQAAGPEGLRTTFLAKSQRLFGDIQLLTPAHMFLLSTLTVQRAGMNGIVLAGEAAHAFPPIGAQGLNLGLRDVADLAAALAAADRSQPSWAIAVSEDYSRRRADDLERTGGMVDTLFRSLLSDYLPAQALRAGGLWALRLLPPLRKQAFGLGMGER
ncbi:FAD-dependent monooxygenase [Devosia sp. ZB163]|uniref:FAD-dependent monooxygenase n=1 Tax=Devosia sp. ZB163 TaxID=3025938 RepID=UPI00235E7644|nr:FAD-dependent monooxygenase [Devosia sp. ZB163]MDC9826070.1 FAD-dependent monooxygenase [Devosia sp. ZB163]